MIRRISALVATLAALPVLAFAIHAFAAGMGQIEGGDIYRVRNVTKGTDFMDPATATCGETVQFKVRIHNPGPSALENVSVVATLPAGNATTHTSRVTVSSPFADPNATSDTATVNLDKPGGIAYIPGTTELLDANGVKLSTLGDTILTSGVNIGSVGISINEKRFVQFQAKVDCPENPPVNIQVCELATKHIITIPENQFDPTKHSKDLSKCAEVPPITVCELATKKIITIREDQFDANKHSRDLTKCADTPPGSITVCELSTKQLISIKENEFDANKHTRDLAKCATTPIVTAATTPTQLVNTGPGELLGMVASVMVGGVIAHRLVWNRRF